MRKEEKNQRLRTRGNAWRRAAERMWLSMHFDAGHGKPFELMPKRDWDNIQELINEAYKEENQLC